MMDNNKKDKKGELARDSYCQRYRLQNKPRGAAA
jgi:hypothetical protein